jgi:hypothetical protein
MLAISAGALATPKGDRLEEMKAIAKDAYVYGFPVVESYRIMNAYTLNTKSPEYKAPFNEIKNVPRVFTSADRAIQTPNSDTPYSFAWLDLRSEPVVLTLPAVDKNRYFSIQLFDGTALQDLAR